MFERVLNKKRSCHLASLFDFVKLDALKWDREKVALNENDWFGSVFLALEPVDMALIGY